MSDKTDKMVDTFVEIVLRLTEERGHLSIGELIAIAEGIASVELDQDPDGQTYSVESPQD